MLIKNDYVIWGGYCHNCGCECSILQNSHHPWIDTPFTIKLKCTSCSHEVIIDQRHAEIFYNNMIYSYYTDLYGNIIDLGCGGGFLSRYLINKKRINKIYGIDIDKSCFDELSDIITAENKFEFINSDLNNTYQILNNKSIDFLISRDVFMFVEDTDRYFDDITKIVNKGIRQMAWYLKDNSRMKNQLEPKQIAYEYTKRGWNVELEYLDWYKYGYFISAYKL